MWSPSRRRGALIAASTAVLLSLATGCGTGGTTAAPSTTTRPGTRIEIAPGAVTVESAGAPATLADADRDAVVDVVRRYVIAATVDPLTGRPVGDLSSLFTADAAPGLAGPNRAAVVDEGLPEAMGTVRAVAAPLALTALSDASGAIDLVGTTLDLGVETRTAQGPVAIKRVGELVLAREAASWKITSFRLLVTRTGAGLGPDTPPTSTASSTQ